MKITVINCRYCDLPEAGTSDWKRDPDGGCEKLCWGRCDRNAERSLFRVIGDLNMMMGCLTTIADGKFSAKQCRTMASVIIEEYSKKP